MPVDRKTRPIGEDRDRRPSVVRNLYDLNGFLVGPQSTCRTKIGPGEPNLISAAANTIMGENPTSPATATTMSNARLTASPIRSRLASTMIKGNCVGLRAIAAPEHAIWDLFFSLRMDAT